jgi:hypothetical protein
MQEFNLFQDRIEGDPNQITRMEKHFERMQDFLDGYVDEGDIKEDLFDQLTWLKFQIDYCKEGGQAQLLIDNFNWVVSNFNNDLRLDEDALLLFLYNDDYM